MQPRAPHMTLAGDFFDPPAQTRTAKTHDTHEANTPDTRDFSLLAFPVRSFKTRMS
jgi:hypothetical protein